MGDTAGDGGVDGGPARRSLDDLSKEELLKFIRKLRDSHNTLKTEFSECEIAKNTVQKDKVISKNSKISYKFTMI